MLLKIAIFPIFSIFLWVPSKCQTLTTNNPQIKLELLNNVYTNWMNITVQNWEFAEINNEAVLISLTKSELELGCEATFPIQWNLTGHIRDPDFVQIQPYKRKITRVKGDKLEFLFKIGIIIFFDNVQNFTSSSSRIYCQRAGNPDFSKSFAVFLRNVNPPFVNSGEELTVVDSEIIPCSTTDPTLPVRLMIRNGHPVISGNQFSSVQYSSVNSSNYIYDPLIGFRFQKKVEGNFICITVNDTVTVSASLTRFAVPGYDYFPKRPLVKIFTDEELVLKCSRNLIQIGDGRSVNTDILVNISMNHTVIKTTQIDNLTNSTVVTAKIRSTVDGNGTAFCVGNGGITIWTWSLEFVVPPVLVLNNFEQEVNCASDYDDRTVSTVRCRDPSHCEYMKHCFEDPNLCNFNFRKQFHSNDPKYCRDWILQEGYNCSSVPYAHLNGAVACSTRGLVRHFMFFVSLEFLRRANWQELQPSELVALDDVGPILYTNKTSTFFCRAVSFLFADDLKFSIEFQNKTKLFLNNSEYNITIFDGSSPRKVQEFNILAQLEINLPIDAVATHCHAPWSNSTDFFSVQQRFETRHLLHPKILTTQDQSSVSFVIGLMSTQRLNCSAIGEPQPKYRWLKDGVEVQNSSVSHQIQITTGSNGESFLEFLAVDHSTKPSDYVCIAENTVGNDTLIFRLNVIEGEEFGGPSSSTYGTLIGTILFVLLGVIMVLGYVVNRYLKAKELIRGLTENEIDEFFKGRPELVNSNQALKAEHLDLMPYDDKYEIDMDHVDFDSSQILGTGEFSVVVKGRLRTSGLEVAIKIAKSSADVTLFKTLLSEVKIMIFIGKHDNIVSLYGVSTRHIRTRNIHIILEMCENGSLESYLRKGRTGFINLIDQSQKINLQVLNSRPDAEDRLSTLNLIKWAHQIAKGMEYLSFKGIVHADLACRNVLLNGDNVAKISDFGLSKKLYECTNYVKKTKSPLPWRWMSLEALTTLTFSKESDAWAYGTVLWEIFSLGDTPFPNETWDKEFLCRLSSGMRMGKPKFSTLEIYSQMVNCWDSDPICRPEFSSMRKYFSNLLEQFAYERIETERGSDLTFIRDSISPSDEQENSSTANYSNNVGNLYANLDPEENMTPQYTNIDNSGMYSNVP